MLWTKVASALEGLTWPNAEATFVQSTLDAKIFKKNFIIHWIALSEYSQMGTNVPGFQSFFRFFSSFCFDEISLQQHKGFKATRPMCLKLHVLE